MGDDKSTFGDYKKLMNATFERQDADIAALRLENLEQSKKLAAVRSDVDWLKRAHAPGGTTGPYTPPSITSPPPPPAKPSSGMSDKTKIIIAIISGVVTIITTFLTVYFATR